MGYFQINSLDTVKNGTWNRSKTIIGSTELVTVDFHLKYAFFFWKVCFQKLGIGYNI